MRMVVEFQLPVEPFNTLVRKGTAGETLEKIMDAIKPEATYFMAREGKRGGIMVVDVAEPSRIPQIAEHFFLAFEATCAFHPCLTPEDLAKAKLEDFRGAYA